MRNEWQFDWTGTRRNDRIVESDGRWTIFAFNNQSIRAREFALTGDNFHFTAFRHACQTTGQLVDDFLFPQTHFVDVCFRLTENNTVLFQSFRFGDHFRYVQQGFRRDTTDVQADATERGITLNQNGFKTYLSATQSSRVARRARPKYHDLSFNFSTHHGLLIVCPAGQTSFLMRMGMLIQY